MRENLTPSLRADQGFSLIELLVVIAILVLLVSMLLPSLRIARELARTAKVHAELYGLGLAIEMYAVEHGGEVPPVRVDCNSDLQDHWCQLPVELADGGYLPKGPAQGGLAAAVEDEYHPEHTYKYAALGPGLLNGEAGVYDHQMWVPDDFPLCQSDTGRYEDDPKTAPVKWAVWSLGPEPAGEKSKDPQAPLAGRTWYETAGDTGVLVRFAARRGGQHKSP